MSVSDHFTIMDRLGWSSPQDQARLHFLVWFGTCPPTSVVNGGGGGRGGGVTTLTSQNQVMRMAQQFLFPNIPMTNYVMALFFLPYIHYDVIYKTRKF